MILRWGEQLIIGEARYGMRHNMKRSELEQMKVFFLSDRSKCKSLKVKQRRKLRELMPDDYTFSLR